MIPLMARVLAYRCSLCAGEYEPADVFYTCPRDGGNVEAVLDLEPLRKRGPRFGREPSLWRYLPLLPLADPGAEGTSFRSPGWTPLYCLPRLGERLGLQNFWLKDESTNPTASFKDRASAVVVARALEIGAGVVAAASTGNAGAALAGMAAARGLPAVIFAPRTAPPAKITQLLIYGARVVLVDGSYDQAFKLSLEACRRYGWYCRNTGVNPFTLEGKKTAAFEIWEHIREGRLAHGTERPLSVFVSVGDGNIISGLHRGFKDLLSLGWLERSPRLFGVQAEGSAAVAAAFRRGGEEILPVRARTLADSICVDLPRDGVRALRAAVQTGGAYLTVSDGQILAAIAELGRAGIFAEPAAAAAYAGLEAACRQGMLSGEDPVLVLSTGSGLKDIQAARRAVAEAPVSEPSLEAVEKLLPGELKRRMRDD